MGNSNRTPPPGAAGNVACHFRWDTVPAPERDWLRRRTEDIVGLAYRQACDTVRIGVWLQEARKRLRKRTYEAWVASQLPFSVSVAFRYRQVAKAFAGFASVQFERFDPSALYVLSQLQTAPGARAHAVQLAESGERVTHALALQIVDAHRDPPEPRPARVAGPAGPPAPVPVVTAPQPEPPEAARWRRMARLAAACKLVRIERLEDTEYEGDEVVFSVTVHTEDGLPRCAVRRELHDAVACLLGEEELRKCSAPGCGMRPAGMFGRNADIPGGLNYRCKACEKARKAEYKARKRATREAIRSAPDAPAA